jgi:hypothetical protein
MENPKKPPLDFWLWLAVIGLTAIVAVSSLTFAERIMPGWDQRPVLVR